MGSLHDELNPTQQLLLLKDFTKKTGVVHEAQAMQLRLQPFVLDPALESAEVEVNFETRTVNYQLKDADKPAAWKPDRGYKIRLNALDSFVKEILFGMSWKIAVFMNGTSIFTSGDKKSARKQRSKSKRKQHNRRTGRRR